MSSILGTTSTSSTSTAATTTQNGRYWGLASGLDVDSIVTGLVSDKQAQIDKANQSKQTIQWQQTAYQSSVSSLNTFQSAYLDIIGSNSVLSSKAYSTYSASSDNTAVSAIANSDASAGQHAIQILQSAVAGSVTGSQLNSTITGTASPLTLAQLDGTKFNVTIDGVTKTVTVNKNDTARSGTTDLAGVLQTEINTAFGSTKDDTDKVVVSQDSTSGLITIASSSNYQSVVSVTGTNTTITGAASFTSILNDDTLTKDDKIHELDSLFSGTDFNITVNGVTKNISFTDADFSSFDPDHPTDFLTGVFQKKVDDAVGSGNVKVSFDTSGKINFQSNSVNAAKITLTDGTAGNNTLAKLVIQSGTNIADSLTGLGIASGASNRINSSASLSTIFGSNAITADASGNFSVTINGVNISLSTKDSLTSTLAKINTSKAGVTATYSAATGKVSITSSTTGASTTVQYDKDNSFFKTLLGLSTSTDVKTTQGLDAVFTLDGTKYSRSSNNFTFDNITYTINNKIDGSTSNPTQAANVNLTSDVTSAVKSLTDFVNAYNTLVSSINTQITTKPDSNYPPLTDTQKSSMKDADITAWNTKAQAGVLFDDATLSGMLTSMTNMIYQPVTTSSGTSISLYQIGITTSPDYLQGGALQIDTTKLTAALQNDPNSVQELFTKASSTGYDVVGGSAQAMRKKEEGIGYRLQDIINDATQTGVYPYVGSLIKIAGTATDTSTNYELNSKLKDISDNITKYKADMTTKKNQLYAKFTKLETLMEQMNSQSSMISSFGSSGS
jgi:flagellar hook-associated protein 2